MTTASTPSSAPTTSARSPSVTSGRPSPLRRRTEASELSANHQGVAQRAGGPEVAHVPDVQQVEAPVGEDDALAGRSPLGGAAVPPHQASRSDAIGANGGGELGARHGGRPPLQHDEPAGDVGEGGRLRGRTARRQGHRERGDHGVARARHVGDLVGPVDGEERHGAVSLEQRHAAAAPGHQEIAGVQAIEDEPAGLVDAPVVVQLHPGEGLDLWLVGGRRGDAAEAGQIVAAVHRDDRPGARGQGPHEIEHAGRHRPVSVVRHQEGVGAGAERGQPGQQGVLAARIELGLGLAVQTHDLLEGRGVPARHDTRLHRGDASGRGHQPVEGDPGPGEQRAHLRAGLVHSEHAHRDDLRPERAGVVGGVGGAPEAHLPAREAQDDDGRLAGHAGRLAVEVLVGDQVSDHDHAPGSEGGDHCSDPIRQRHDSRSASAHSTASSKSSATCSGVARHRWRRCSHSPRP